MSNVGIIGGADGPTAIFVTSALPRMLNPWGMAIILLMMIPNVIFALRHRNMENRCKSRFINILEQIGRYGCLVLMIICIGLDKFGFGVGLSWGAVRFDTDKIAVPELIEI